MSAKRTVASGSEAALARVKAGPKKSSGGNSVCDQRWIEEMLEDGSLVDISEEEFRPPGYLFEGTIYQWQVPGDEANPEFFEQYRPLNKGPRRCNGTAYVRDLRGGYVVDVDWIRITRPCLATPARGADVCQAHGAKIPVVRAAAQRRLAEASEMVAMRLIGMTGVRDEAKRLIRPQDRITAMGQVLDRAGVKGGVEVEVTAPGFKKVLEELFGTDGGDDEKD